MTTTKIDNLAGARGNAEAWYGTIKEQVSALDGCEAAAIEAGWVSFRDKFNVLCWRHTEAMGDAEPVVSTWAGTAKDLCEEFNIDTSTAIEQAQERVQEGPLSVQVRDGWHSPGQAHDGVGEPEEFSILLTTGGPALRIYGTLDDSCQPDECELQMQDWGTPWTKWVPAPYDEEYRDTLRAYAACFYFGE